MDEVKLIESELSSTDMAACTELPYIRLEFTPLNLSRLSALTTPQPNRVDFEDLLTQVNADSITWFIQQMQDMGTRCATAPNVLAVATWIQSQFSRFGIADSQLDPFTVQGLQQYNVVATIPGIQNPGKIIIIGGHHDSITNGGGDPNISAPGADDNASGTAVTLEIARILKANNYQPECTIRFVTFGCEEFGLWGSKHYAQLAAEQNMDVKIMINHDMIANSTLPSANWAVRMMPYEGFEAYTAYAMNVIDNNTLLAPYPGNLNSAGSDSHSFWQRGFPAIYFFEDQFCPYYHSESDIVANINPQYAKEMIKASLAVAMTYDQVPSPVNGVWINDTGTGNSLQLNWSSLSMESDVQSYKIYVTSEPGVIQNTYTTTGNSYTVPNLTSGMLYYLGVAGMDADNNEGLARFITGTPNVIPTVPQFFSDQPAMHAVILNWTANPELDIAGYQLFRSTTETGNYTQVNPNLITTTSYEDNSVTDLQYYYYKLKAVDTTDHYSEFTPVVYSRAITLNQGILIVDETRNNAGNTVFAPNDQVSDAFFANIMSGFETTQFDIENDGLLKLADIGVYSSILWHGNDYGDMTYPYQVRDAIAQYLQAGGKILASTYLPSQSWDENNAYPRTYGPGDFMSEVFGIQNVDYTTTARFRYALPEGSGYPPLQVDSLKTISSLNHHIFTIESIGTQLDTHEIYYYGSDYDDTVSQGSLNGLPVGVYHSNGNAVSVLLSFPLYNMQQADARNLMLYVFNQLFAEVPVNDDTAQIPFTGLELTSASPNPFQSIVSLSAKTKDTAQPLSAAVYNVKGQKVKTLFHGIPKTQKLSLNWDGTDSQGHRASSSIYFIRVEQGGRAASRKLVMLK
jgi:hypothetical protein